MNANELRIGNFISDYEAEPNKTIYWQVETIEYLNKTLGVRFRNGSCWTCEEMIEPIPLTEEWLEKFGFENGYLRIVNGLLVWVDDELWVTYTNGVRSGCLNHIKYVHQLQNLYFALTGEELTIK